MTLFRTRTRLAIFALPIGFAAAVFACGSPDNLPPPPPPPPVPATDAATTVSTVAPPSGPTPPKAPAPPVTLTLGAASPDVTPLPTVAIAAPSKEQVIPSDKVSDFTVKLDVKNWQTAPGSSHIHLILDNKPYKPIFDQKIPVKMSDLTGGAALDEGRHVLVAFPSRANHESVKSKGALSVITFWVGKKGDAATQPDPTKKPMLIYSRPKGDYKGEMANHVLVDFYLSGVTLADGKEHVNITVNGPGIDKPLTARADKWGPPFYLDNLQNGSYDIKAELVDGTDKLIDGPWNSTSRKINVDHDAPMDPNMGHGPMPGMDGGAPPATTKGKPGPMPTMTGNLPPLGPSSGGGSGMKP